MKQYAGMGINFAKSLKYDETDRNEEAVYAEINMILTETKYELSNVGNIVRTKTVDEIELCVTADSARQMAEQLTDLANKLDELEKRQNIEC